MVSKGSWLSWEQQRGGTQASHSKAEPWAALRRVRRDVKPPPYGAACHSAEICASQAGPGSRPKDHFPLQAAPWSQPQPRTASWGHQGHCPSGHMCRCRLCPAQGRPEPGRRALFVLLSSSLGSWGIGACPVSRGWSLGSRPRAADCPCSAQATATQSGGRLLGDLAEDRAHWGPVGWCDLGDLCPAASRARPVGLAAALTC